MGHGDGSTRRSHSAATKSVNERPPMNTDPCSSVLLTCKSLSGGQGYFHREEREEKRFQKLRVLRLFAVDFFGCGCAALCDSWPRFLGLGFGAVTGDLSQVALALFAA